MSVTVDCPSCKRKIRVPDTAAGRRGKCPSCGTILDVPTAAQVVVFATLSLDEDDLPYGHTSPVPEPGPAVASSSSGGARSSSLKAVASALHGHHSGEASGGVSPRSVGASHSAGPLRVAVVDFDMPFWSIVMLMVKLVIAAIPAIFILCLIWFIVSALAMLVALSLMAPWGR